MRALAARLGVTGDPSLLAVTLTQAGTLREGPEDRERRFSATQRIELRRPGFEWRARIGPLGAPSVTDRLREGEAEVELRLLGLLRLARARGGAALLKGEVMRYLAELPWAPDAMLANPAPRWRAAGPGSLRVATGEGEAAGEVEFHLDGAGGIVGFRAGGRPRREGSGFAERPWHGCFGDYRLHAGRWLPFAGEVGWEVERRSFTVWRGRLLDWTIG